MYVVEALSHIPTNESRYAYVELISPNGALVSRIKLKENEGAYFGYLDIPANAKTGRYVLRSYTLLSLIHISEPTRPCGTSRMPSSA